MEWTRRLVLEFLHLLEEEPVLWNPRLRNYKDKHAQYNAWRRIENNFSARMSVAELKKKAESLMLNHRQFCRKESTEGEPNAISKPKWFAYKKIDFMHGMYKSRKPTSEKIEGEDAENNTEKDEVIEPTVTTPTTLLPSIGCRRKNSKINKIEQEMHESQNFLNIGTQHRAKDEYELFGELLATKLRSMDESTREQTMFEINNLVYQAKLPMPYEHASHKWNPLMSFTYSSQACQTSPNSHAMVSTRPSHRSRSTERSTRTHTHPATR